MVASHRSVILQLRTRLASLRLLSLELEPLFYQLSPLSPERCNAFHLTPITPGFSAEPCVQSSPRSRHPRYPPFCGVTSVRQLLNHNRPKELAQVSRSGLVWRQSRRVKISWYEFLEPLSRCAVGHRICPIIYDARVANLA